MSLWDDYRDDYEIAKLESIKRFETRQYVLGEMLKKGIWKMKNGTEVKIKDMSETHIRNCINMLKRSDIYNCIDHCVEKDYVKVFEKQLAKIEAQNNIKGAS